MGITNGGLISSSSKTTQQESLALSDGLACATASFSGVTTTSISHNLNSTDLVVEFVDSVGNLLIPDNWSIVNNNVIEAEFSPAATGRATIIACVTSGLAPITGGVTLLEGLSGIIDLDSPNGGIDISTSGQVINLNAIFTPASGAVLEQKCRDIDTLSGLISSAASGTTINGLSGQLQLVSPNDGIVISESGQTIFISGLFTSASGAIIDQKCEDLLTLSGLIGTGAGGSGVSVELFFTPASGTNFVLEHALGTDIFTWDMWSTEFDPIRTIQPTNVYPSGNDHVAIEIDLPASGRLVLTAGGAVAGPSGAIGPQGPQGPQASGACSVHNFEPSDGTLFVVTHALNTENFTWSMWHIDSSPLDATIVPTNVAPSGANHAIVELDIAMSGKLVIQGCPSSGISVGDTIAARTVSDSYTATSLDSAIFVDASTGSKTITLLNPSGVEGKSLYIKKIDASGTTVTLSANGSGLIDGNNTAIIIAQYDALRVTAHNGNWWIL